jgi:hypothetical protein
MASADLTINPRDIIACEPRLSVTARSGDQGFER